MPLFSRFKNKGAQPAAKGKHTTDLTNGKPTVPAVPRWASNWNSKSVVPEDVEELIHHCTVEMKSRGMLVSFYDVRGQILIHSQPKHSTLLFYSYLSDFIPTLVELAPLYATSSSPIRKDRESFEDRACSKS